MKNKKTTITSVELAVSQLTYWDLLHFSAMNTFWGIKENTTTDKMSMECHSFWPHHYILLFLAHWFHVPHAYVKLRIFPWEW